MIDDLDLLYLSSPVGKGQENNPDDVEALDGRLRKVGAYDPPPEYADNPQRYPTEPMIGALERYQEQNGLKIDGIANPGGPTERAINNHLLEKPRGAGLLYDPPSALRGTVGNGFENRREDVSSVQRRLGALSHLPEDPFDNPRGFIDEATTNGIKAFQRAKGLVEDGWLAPRGETELALDNAVSDLARLNGRDWFAFADRARRAQQAFATKLGGTRDDTTSADDGDGTGEITLAYAPGTTPPPPQARTSPGRPQQSRPFDHRGPFGLDPRYAPTPRPRWSGPPARDLEFRNPGEPHTRQLPQPLRTRVPLGPPTRETGPVSVDDLDRALRREPLPSPDKRRTYVPDPGSPLGIPLLDFNPFGSPGDPRTVDANRILAKAIEDGCKEEMKDATVTHHAGPGSTDKGETAVRGAEGRSFPDTETQIKYKDVTIRIFGDTYTPKADGGPDSRERRQFAKLDRNAEAHNRVFVRLPKPWMIGEEINPERLKDFTKKLCREVKQAVDEGKLGDGKDKLRLERIFEELTKRKKAATEGPRSDPGQPRP